MTENPGHDELYDAFLDALLDGDRPDPQEFLQQAGVVDTDLLAKLNGLAVACQVLPAAAGTGNDDTVEGLPFQRLGEFRLIMRLGSGGMGTVYLAEQESLGRRVALKVIRSELIGSSNASARFHREAKSLARIQHPNVVTIFGFGIDQGVHYLAMEFVPGLDLTETLQDAADAEVELAPADAVRWALEIGRALQCVHDEGLLHRDVKASNIRITPEGRAVLVDFGLASDSDADGPTLTRSFVGSPATSSPEQIRSSSELDPRTDVYSLGVTLYRCITGHVPFIGDNLEAIFHQVLSVQPVPPRQLRPGIPRDLETVILHAMEKNPERRYQTATAFANDLEAVLEFRPIQAQPPNLRRRAMQWTRRHRASAAALLTAATAVIAGVVFLIVQAEQKRIGVKKNAQDLVAQARQALTEFVQLGDEIASIKNRSIGVERAFETTFVPIKDIRDLNAARNQYRTSDLQRERLFNQALEYLEQAERANPDVQGANAIRAELYVIRYREAIEEGNHAASRFYRTRALRFDDNGSIWNQFMVPAVLGLDVDPPGPVTVFPFRYLEHDQLVLNGEPRMVPVPGLVGDPIPSNAELPLIPGTWCLRVLQNMDPALHGDLIYQIGGANIEGSVFVLRGNAMPEPHELPSIERLDQLVSVDGIAVNDHYHIDQLAVIPNQSRLWQFKRLEQNYEVQATWTELDIKLGLAEDLAQQGKCTATLLRGNQNLTIAVPAGLLTRTTASPRLMLPKYALQIQDPQQTISVEPGEQAFIIRREGFEDFFVQLYAHAEQKELIPIPLVAEHTTPLGFVRVSLQPSWPEPSYWIMDREVTCVEYLEFLNTRESLEAIAASQAPVRFPRSIRNENNGGSWPHNADGTYSIAENWHPLWPAFGVSWDDAVAFAQWKTQQARAAGLPYTYKLPSLSQFRLAGCGATLWPYPYGVDFRPIWSNCCFARPKPEPEPVLRYPIDASLFDVYDCSGSALEWVNEWWDQDHTQRFAAGGSWAQGGATAAKPTSGLGIAPASTSLEVSFRLILEIDD
ncbi:MAG: protein kinase [Planctomycetes bacterium]|nr:protein kinase [Planctomycetota bacterium]